MCNEFMLRNNTSSLRARLPPLCVHCRKEFEKSQLKPIYHYALRCQLLSLKREQEQTQAGLVEDEEVLANENWTEVILNTTISCSACQMQVQPKLLNFCQHCQREVCVQCLAQHRESELQKAIMIQRRLKELLGVAETLGPMVEQVQNLPMTQMCVSDQFCKIDQHRNSLGLVKVDKLASPAPRPRSSTPHNIAYQSKRMTFATTTVKSRVKLFVGGLKPSHTESQMRQYFSQFGTVTECCIVRDYNTDESKGFGFVTYREVEAASRARATHPHLLNNEPVYVRPYKLKTKKEREAEEAAISSSSAKDENEMVGSKGDGSGICAKLKVNDLRLFVRYRNGSTSKQELNEYFSSYGNVRKVIMIPEGKSDDPWGRAFVDMVTPQEVEAILEARPHQMNGESLIVQPVNYRNTKKAKPFKPVGPLYQLAVNDIPPQTKKKTIEELFGKYGEVSKVKMKTKKHRATVTFCTAEALQEAVAAGPICINGVTLRVSPLGAHGCSFNGKVKLVDTSHDVCGSRQDNCGHNQGAQAKLRQHKKPTAQNADQTSHQLLVYDLPFQISKKRIRKFFSRFGAVTKVKVEEAKHEALVDFYTEGALKKAVEAIPPCDRDVDPCDPLPDGCMRIRIPEICGGDATYKLGVTDLPPEVEKKTIEELFGKYGEVSKVKMKTKKHRATVTFCTAEALQEAVAAGPICINGVTLRVSPLGAHGCSFNGKVNMIDSSRHDGDCADADRGGCGLGQDNCETQSEGKSMAETSLNNLAKVETNLAQEGGPLPFIVDACSLLEENHQTEAETVGRLHDQVNVVDTSLHDGNCVDHVSDVCGSKEDNCGTQSEDTCKAGTSGSNDTENVESSPPQDGGPLPPISGVSSPVLCNHQTEAETISSSHDKVEANGGPSQNLDFIVPKTVNPTSDMRNWETQPKDESKGEKGRSKACVLQ
ncbi:hypothetical protein TcWFU_007965 [Taenia crassiceps]|uniref:RRM domain-containing protein n=1 Tax=Taenia crassiceps TaxID=6207 RepID=A0ABR4Q1P9_9CEST